MHYLSVRNLPNVQNHFWPLIIVSMQGNVVSSVENNDPAVSNVQEVEEYVQVISSLEHGYSSRLVAAVSTPFPNLARRLLLPRPRPLMTLEAGERFSTTSKILNLL